MNLNGNRPHLSPSSWILFALASGCAASYELRNDGSIADGQSSWPNASTAPATSLQPQRMSVEQHGVRFTVTYLTDGMVGSHFLAARRINGRDFAPILKDAYVNYAEGKNSELLSLYNEYKEHQADRIRDFWDHPLFSEYIQSPLVGDNGHAYFTVFEVVVENHLNDKVRVQPFSAVLVDDSGIQVSALSKEDLFAELEQSWARLSLTSWALSTTSFSREYFLRSSSRVQRSNLSASTVFGRAQARGYIFFPRLENSVKGFTFILPDVTTLKSGIPDTTFDVEIDFSNR